MAIVTGSTQASPEQVFAVLSDGWLYGNWVVGTSHMRAVEAGWPAAGTKLYHASGLWPVVTRDESVVEEVDPNRRLVLLAKGGFLGQARVIIELVAEGDGTQITMTETPVAGPGKWGHNRASDAILVRRNIEALARLAAIAERRTRPSE